MTYQDPAMEAADPDALARLRADIAGLRRLLEMFGEGPRMRFLEDLLKRLERPEAGRLRIAASVERLRDALADMPIDAPALRSDADAGLRWHGARLDEALGRLAG